MFSRKRDYCSSQSPTFKVLFLDTTSISATYTLIQAQEKMSVTKIVPMARWEIHFFLLAEFRVLSWVPLLIFRFQCSVTYFPKCYFCLGGAQRKSLSNYMTPKSRVGTGLPPELQAQ